MDTAPALPEPRYASWEEFRTRTAPREIRSWCARKAKVANRPKLLGGTPVEKITAQDVWRVLAAARGRCRHCQSLALEHRPSDPITGVPLPWEAVGRRIGSLDHAVPVILGGSNAPDNLGWSCLWCNTWPSDRRPGASDHGAIHPAPEQHHRVQIQQPDPPWPVTPDAADGAGRRSPEWTSAATYGSLTVYSSPMPRRSRRGGQSSTSS